MTPVSSVPDPVNEAKQAGRVTSRLTRYRLGLTGLVFGFTLFMPALDQLAGFSSGFKSTEKHILAPFPTFRFPHVLTYIHEFNQYYKENFGWRNALFYQYSRLKYNLIGVSPLPQKVILGKDGWFFAGDDLSNSASQHLGLHPIPPETLHRIARKLTDKQQQLARQGIKLYVVVAPDAYCIYPEKLPDSRQPASVPSNFDYLKQYVARHTRVPFIDIRPALMAAKATHITYMQTDTHWNDYGALVASMAIAGRIRQDFPAIYLPREDEYTIRPIKGYSGDLVVMMALNQDLSDTVNYAVTPPAPLKTREMERVNNTELGGLPSQRFSTENKKAPSLLFIGDSFTISLAHALPGYFSSSYFVRSTSLRGDLVQTQKPDIVLIEIAERNLANLADL